MKSFFLSSLIALSIVSCTTTVQDTVDYSYATDLMTDTWVGTDALGRTMPEYDEVGPVKHDQRSSASSCERGSLLFPQPARTAAHSIPEDAFEHPVCAE